MVSMLRPAHASLLLFPLLKSFSFKQRAEGKKQWARPAKVCHCEEERCGGKYHCNTDRQSSNRGERHQNDCYKDEGSPSDQSCIHTQIVLLFLS